MNKCLAISVLIITAMALGWTAAAVLASSAGAGTVSKDIDITVTHDAPCPNGPQIVTDKSNYAPGATITVTTTCGSGNPKDWAGVITYYGEIGPNTNTYTAYLGSTTPNAQVTMTAPNVISDRDQQYAVRWFLNNTFAQATTSLPFTINKTISPPAPTATLPASLAADPFTPDHVITVCASGCDFVDLGGATSTAFGNGWDNVQIKISGGEYRYPASSLSYSYPAHLWIKGIAADGKTYPHLFGFTGSSAEMITNHAPYATGAGSLTLDNLEFGPWNFWALEPVDGQTWTLRNVYVRDTVQGLISGNRTDFTLKIYNSVFSRSGGANGPEHDIYVGEGNAGNILNVVNSVFDQPVVGHAFKERAKFFNASCSMFAVNEDDFYLGSETIDMDSGQPTFTNILSVNGGGSPKSWTDNSSWDNIRYGADPEAFIQPLVPTMTGSLLVADQPNSGHWFFTLGWPLTGPVTWGHNTFVWPDAGSRQTGPGGVNQADTTGALVTVHTGNTNDVTLDGTTRYYTSRADAGLPAVGTYPKGWRDYVGMMPASCTDPIGLVKIPTN